MMRALLLIFVLSSAPIATGILLLAAGPLAAIMTQVLKQKAQLTGRWPIVATAGISTVLAALVIGVAFATGEANSWRDIITLTPWVFTEATLIYHLKIPVGLTLTPGQKAEDRVPEPDSPGPPS